MIMIYDYLNNYFFSILFIGKTLKYNWDKIFLHNTKQN